MLALRDAQREAEKPFKGSKLTQLMCWLLTGHQPFWIRRVDREGKRIFLECGRCMFRTAGWTHRRSKEEAA